MAKTINTRIQQKYDTFESWEALEQDISQITIPLDGELIVYGVDDNHSKPNIKIGDGVTPLQSLNFIYDSGNNESSDNTEQPVESVPIQPPTLSQDKLTYNKELQSATLIDFDETTMSIIKDESTESATKAGTYKIVIAPKSGYCWNDNDNNYPRTFTWKIDKADPELQVSHSGNILTDGNTIELSAVTSENLLLDISYIVDEEEQVYYVEELNENLLNVSKDQQDNPYGGVWKLVRIYRNDSNSTGNTSIKIGVYESANYAAASITLNVSVVASGPDSILDNNSWETISYTAQIGRAKDIWNVGNYKLITIPKGTKIGDYFEAKQDIECAAVILGFDHDGEGTNTIDFGFPFSVTRKADGTVKLQKLIMEDALYGTEFAGSGSAFAIGNDNHSMYFDNNHTTTYSFPCCWPYHTNSAIKGCLINIIDNVFDTTLKNELVDMPMYTSVLTRTITDVSGPQPITHYKLTYASGDKYSIQDPSLRKLKIPSIGEIGQLARINNLFTIGGSDSFYPGIDAESPIDICYSYGLTKTYDYYMNGNAGDTMHLKDSGEIVSGNPDYWLRDYTEETCYTNTDTFVSHTGLTLCYRMSQVYYSQPSSSRCLYVIFRVGGIANE